MAYVLLAIGVLMSVVGAYATITGYHIVQVEEGWTSVIAGSVLFVGGFIMMALGLVLRTLLKVQTALVAVPHTVQTGDAAPVLAGPLKLPGGSPPAPPAVSAAKIEPQVEDQLRPSRPPRPPVLPPAAPVAQPPSVPMESVSVPPVGPPPIPVGLAPPVERAEPSGLDAVEAEVLEPAFFEAAPTEPEVETPRPSDDYKLETPSTSEHNLVDADAVPPPEDDWLDRAFAEFDQEIPTPPTKNEPPRGDVAKNDGPKLPKIEHSAPDAPPKFERAFAEAELAAVEPATVAPAPKPGPTAPSPVSGLAGTVIGRYESDGTSYVMYADGSIEAHSETGVYRFASMAELKAFIES